MCCNEFIISSKFFTTYLCAKFSSLPIYFINGHLSPLLIFFKIWNPSNINALDPRHLYGFVKIKHGRQYAQFVFKKNYSQSKNNISWGEKTMPIFTNIIRGI